MDRRDLLLGLLAAPVAASTLARPALAQTNTPASPASILADGAAFSRQALLDAARALAKQPYKAPAAANLPRQLQQLTRDAYRQIRFRRDRGMWIGEGRGVTLDFQHPGYIFGTPVAIRVVENGIVREMRYSPDLFDFGTLQPPPPDADLGFSGLRLSLQKDQLFEDIVLFQGLTYFQAIARGQTFGTLARAFTLKVGDQAGEEMPLFRALFVERPAQGANAITVYALADSESTSALFRFAIRPGNVTVADVEATFLPRVNLDALGVAPLASMYLFGPNDRGGVDDYRPEVHDASGLAMWTGANEWIWRPLSDPETLQISVFADQNPKGFGLLQRERNFRAFEDMDQRFELRPTVWVEPVGDWGPGAIHLIEIPSDSEANRNILAQWRPRQPIAAGQETTLAYRVFFGWVPPERPSLATVAGTRVGRAPQRRRLFVLDYAGEIFADPQRSAQIKPVVSQSRGKILNVTGRPNPDTRGYRVTFEVDPENNPLVELRAILEIDGAAQSETWLYRWTP